MESEQLDRMGYRLNEAKKAIDLLRLKAQDEGFQLNPHAVAPQLVSDVAETLDQLHSIIVLLDDRLNKLEQSSQ